MQTQHKTAQLICILTRIIALWSEHLAFKSLTNVPARICSDSLSSRTEIFISFIVGVERPHFLNHRCRLSKFCIACNCRISPWETLWIHSDCKFMNPTLQELSSQGPAPRLMWQRLGCQSCKWCMVCQSLVYIKNVLLWENENVDFSMRPPSEVELLIFGLLGLHVQSVVLQELLVGHFLQEFLAQKK